MESSKVCQGMLEWRGSLGEERERIREERERGGKGIMIIVAARNKGFFSFS